MENYETYFHMKIHKKMHQKDLATILSELGLAKSKINYLLQNRCCFVNGNLYQTLSPLKINDYVMIDISNYERVDYIPEEKELEVIYEDEYLLVINKPSGYIIYPENKDGKHTIANFVAAYYVKHGIKATIRHCHRLDQGTTGCLIFAKDVITHSAMSGLFETRQVKKTYFALVEGVVKEKGTIDFPIGKDRHINGKMIVYAKGKKALTTYKPLSVKKNRSLLEVSIDTGRTHQIRVHLATIGHPLVGDTLYGASTPSPMMLHCKTITFIHPITQEKIYLDAKLPVDFKAKDTRNHAKKDL